MSVKKIRDLAVISGIYLLAYAVGIAATLPFHATVLRFAAFDLAATLVTFVFSVALRNSSVYDAYWSLTPAVMALWLFIEEKTTDPFALVTLAVFLLWAIRLTANWVVVFTDFSYEDWRYRKYRDENPPALWFFINLTGIHLVPTVVVFLGFLPLFGIAGGAPGPLSLIGDAVILFGIALEFFADREMHAHLASEGHKGVCRVGLWNRSRHPNYLGEISVWLGVYLAMLPSRPDLWYFGIGFVAVTLLFNVVSIPLMEKRQLARRPDYAEYKKTTSRLLLLPHKRAN